MAAAALLLHTVTDAALNCTDLQPVMVDCVKHRAGHQLYFSTTYRISHLDQFDKQSVHIRPEPRIQEYV